MAYYGDGVRDKTGGLTTACIALSMIKADPIQTTIEKNRILPRLDYMSVPEDCQRPVETAKEDIWEDKPEGGKLLRFKKGEKMGADGVAFDRLAAIMLQAIRELSSRVDKLEKS